MKISVEDGTYAVCKLNAAFLPSVDSFLSLTLTGEEISLVCRQEAVPPDAVEIQRDFALLKIAGPLDFALVGILAGISDVLSREKISIFCISTYDTDYILIRKRKLECGIRALLRNGYQLK